MRWPWKRARKTEEPPPAREPEYVRSALSGPITAVPSPTWDANDAVCVACGESGGIYVNIVITGDGWRAIKDIRYGDDGLEFKEGYLENNGTEEDYREGYACGNCEFEATTLEEMVQRRGDRPMGPTCACGHDRDEHPAPRHRLDTSLYTRHRLPCKAPGCKCWDFETDPALASYVPPTDQGRMAS